MTPDLIDHPRWWQWPTILSLDAPVVCVVWQRLLARGGADPVGWPHVFVLGASVWLAYAADRWLEGWHLEQTRVRTARHLFYQRRRWSVAAVWGAMLAADIGVAFGRLAWPDISRGLILVALVLVYLFSHQLLHRARRWRAPKEVVIAVLLTGGVTVFLVGRVGVGTLAVPLTLFALLCFANCALISWWERSVDIAHGQTSLALQSRWTGRLIGWLPWTVAAAAAVAALAGGATSQAPAWCALASALLLAAIDRAEGRLGWALAHALADAALVTPIVLVVWRP